MYGNKIVDLDELVGKTIKEITGLEENSYPYEVRIICDDGNTYLFYHEQDCCESVVLEDFEVSADSLEGGKILSAEEVTNDNDGEKPFEEAGSWTWTFYKIETDKGGLWMRWLGTSNGYYSESVDLVWENKPTVN